MESDYHFSNYWVNRGGAMSNMKCPICGTILDKAFINDKIRGCPKCRNMGNIELWQELIRTRKALEQSEICCTEWEKQALDYKAENIALSDELERTRKALEIAVYALNRYEWDGSFDHNGEFNLDMKEMTLAHKVLAEIKAITALEQKDK